MNDEDLLWIANAFAFVCSTVWHFVIL